MLIILLVVLFCIAISTYLIIVGGSMNKSNYEKELEDEEQMKYIRNHTRRKNCEK